MLKCVNVSGGICIRRQRVKKKHLRESFPYKRPLREENLLEQTRSSKLFGYVQCDIEVPDEIKKKFANFPPIFKNTNIGRHDIGSLMQDYAEKEGLLCQPRKMLILCYFLENGTLITPLLLFYLELGLVCKKIYRFVDYTPVICLNKFVQSAVNARREGVKSRESKLWCCRRNNEIACQQLLRLSNHGS